MSVLEAEGLTVTAHFGPNQVGVLRDLSFSLHPGRVLGLVGESGAGKSMLGRVVAGDLPAGFTVNAGSLLFGGVPLPSARRPLLGNQIAFIPQEPMAALDPVMTVGGQFGEHLARLGVPRADRVPRMLAALAEVWLNDPAAVLRRYPFQLSGGMCQRVLIAMAFASRPVLLVADEPTTALDVSTQAVVAGLLRRMQREHGTAVLFITHDLRLAAAVCDDLLVLHAGDLVERGPAHAVTLAPRHPYTVALIGAAPALRGTRQRLVALPDVMPSLEAYAAMPGCRFAARCPVADPACAAAMPPLRLVGAGHVVRAAAACLHPAAPRSDLPLPAPPPSGETLLQLDGVARHYRQRGLFSRRAPTVAVQDASLAVRAGEFVGVIGESGSGKSTLARLAMGIEQPSAGRVAVLGQDVSGGGRAARVLRLRTMGMVFQDSAAALNPRRTVLRAVTQAMEAQGAPLAARTARAEALLAMTGLSPALLHRMPGQLSGGQRQRVNIARALCNTPRLLVADEIVSGLDVSVQAQILNLLLDLRAAMGLAVLFISHDLAVVRYLCERVVVMQGGAVVEAGGTAQVFADPSHPYTRSLLAAVPDLHARPILEDA